MRTFFSEDHSLHFPQGELSEGELVTPCKRPSRVEYGLDRLRARGFAAPWNWGRWAWPLRGGFWMLISGAFLKPPRTNGWPRAIPVRSSGSPCQCRTCGWTAGPGQSTGGWAITATRWRLRSPLEPAAALSSMASAQAAQRHMAGGARAAFALCRPPGHPDTRTPCDS